MVRDRIFCGAAFLLLAVSGISCSAARAQVVPHRLSVNQVKRVMRQLKRDAARSCKSLDSALDHSRLDGTNREDDINDFMKDYGRSTDQLYDRFKDNKSVSADVEKVLNNAARIDRFMSRHAFGGRAERDWSAVRQDLSRLADAYNVTWRWW